MITRVNQNLGLLDPAVAPRAAAHLEREGWALLPGVLTADEVAELADDVQRVYREYEADVRHRLADYSEFRYEMYNRSAVVQQLIGHRAVLDVIEPVLGPDCHVIANQAWNNPPDHGGGPWHCDAGPHVPRPEGVPWDDRIPYPIFVVGVHFWLSPISAAEGPTAVVPGSHRSGRLPPRDQLWDPDLTFDGRGSVTPEAEPGDVLMFVSDVWHRGSPATLDGKGRLFVQCHYGRRDIAQRVLPTARVNHVAPQAVARIGSTRERQLLGLHEPRFYDG
ncbi:MAG: phytanoyl-CoA dioxygenase family protein [Actinomycetota bacterium]|nr:phytanoyl-CoA dioxygenase family protein [Actinomycetota bacterium]